MLLRISPKSERLNGVIIKPGEVFSYRKLVGKPAAKKGYLPGKVGDEFLFGEWRASAPPANIYKIIERNHEMKMQPWGGYSRHNELYRQKFSPDGELLGEQLVVTNSALMVYSPFIDASDNCTFVNDVRLF